MYIKINYLILVFSLLLLSCEVEKLKPDASFKINSGIAYTGRMLTFDASSSKDPNNDSFQLTFRWDFNGDGVWDTEFATDKKVNWIYSESGVFIVRLEVMNSGGLTAQATDSVQILGKFPDSILSDPRDGQVYRIVKKNGLWIMAENLRYGTWISTKKEQTNNQVVEYYLFNDDSSNYLTYGGLYSWEESMNWEVRVNNQGICPPGWRIPELVDWYRVDIKVPHAFLSEYYGPSSLSGLNLQYSGSYLSGPVNLPTFEGDHFSGGGSSGAYWYNAHSTSSNGMRIYGWIGFWKFPSSFMDLWGLKGLQINRASYDQRDNKGNLVLISAFHSVRCVRDE